MSTTDDQRRGSMMMQPQPQSQGWCDWMKSNPLLILIIIIAIAIGIWYWYSNKEGSGTNSSSEMMPKSNGLNITRIRGGYY